MSLTQLVEGVTAAQKATKPMGAKINPAGIQPSRPSSDNLIYVDQHSHVYVPQMIEFDVALGTTEAEDGKAGAGSSSAPFCSGPGSNQDRRLPHSAGSSSPSRSSFHLETNRSGGPTPRWSGRRAVGLDCARLGIMRG